MSDEHNSLNSHPKIDGLTLFVAEPAPHEHKVHEHGAYSIIGLTHGSKEFHHQGKTITVNAHEIAVANPGELHGCGPIDGEAWAHRTWYLGPDLMQEIATSLGIEKTVHLQVPVIKDQTIAKQLIAAHEQIHAEEDLLVSQSIALEALSLLVENFAVESSMMPTKLKSKADDRMVIYEDWLSKHIDQPVELAHLAELTGVKRNQVIKDFKSAKGVTPGNYFRLARLKHAKQIIRQGAELAEASNQAGFADQSHFTREFKAAFGFTPKHFQTLANESGGEAPL